MLTRDGVRATLAEMQMIFPSEDQVVLLHGHIARQLIAFDGMPDKNGISSYRVGRLKEKQKDIRVKAYYFKDRQGVTFDFDGFVGIAGWADCINVQPILRALIAWVEEVTGHVHP